MVGESRCYPKAIVAGDLSLYRLHFGSNGSVHDGSLERTRHVCSVDSSSFFVEWHFSTVLEQVVAAGNTVVAVAVAGGEVVGHSRTTIDSAVHLPVPSIVGCIAEVDIIVGDVGIIGGSRCSANVHHDFAVDRIVGSCLVPDRLFCSVCYAVECWSVDALWHDVLKVDEVVLSVHGILLLSVVLVVGAHVFPLVQIFQFPLAVWNAICHGDLGRVVGSLIVLDGD